MGDKAMTQSTADRAAVRADWRPWTVALTCRVCDAASNLGPTRSVERASRDAVAFVRKHLDCAAIAAAGED